MVLLPPAPESTVSSHLQDLANVFAAKDSDEGKAAWSALSSKDKKVASKAYHDLVRVPAREAEARTAGYADAAHMEREMATAREAAVRDARLAAYEAADRRAAAIAAAEVEMSSMTRGEIAAAVAALVGAPVVKAKLNMSSAYYLIGGVDLRVSDHGQVEGGGLDLTTGYRNGEATASIDPSTVAAAGSLQAAIAAAAQLVKAAIAEMSQETS